MAELKRSVELKGKNKPVGIAPTKDKAQDMSGFKYEEETTGLSKSVITIFGAKGTGKTSLSFSVHGNIGCLSLDKKSTIIKENMFDNDSRIKVFNAVKFYDWDKDEITASAFKTYNFMLYLLEQMRKDDIDWVVIDGYEIFASICEMKMRYENNLSPFQGIANRMLWKSRRLDIRKMHNLALDVANKGVVYTTYSDKDDIVIDGTLMCRNDVPKYTDVIMWETDVVVNTSTQRVNDKLIHIADVKTSKLKEIPETIYEVQGEKAKEMFQPLA